MPSLWLVGFPKPAGGPLWETENETWWTKILHSLSYVLYLQQSQQRIVGNWLTRGKKRLFLPAKYSQSSNWLKAWITLTSSKVPIRTQMESFHSWTGKCFACKRSLTSSVKRNLDSKTVTLESVAASYGHTLHSTIYSNWGWLPQGQAEVHHCKLEMPRNELGPSTCKASALLGWQFRFTPNHCQFVTSVLCTSVLNFWLKGKNCCACLMAS